MSTEISPADIINQAVRVLPFVERGREGRDEYDDAYGDLQDQFKNSLFEQFGTGLNRGQHERVYKAAESEGHASGWHDIQNCYIDFADFARDIIDAENGRINTTP
jgi:hypothetical protein